MLPLLKIIIVVMAGALLAGAADLTPAQRKLNADSFEHAWSTIQTHMWGPMPPGVNWQAVHDELKPRAAAARSMEESRGILRDMISRLKMTHFGIVPEDVYDGLHATRAGGGAPGFEIRLVEGKATVVSVEPEAPAYIQGIRPGWQIVKAGDTDITQLTARLQAEFLESTMKEMLITRAIAARLDGPVGGKVQTDFLDSRGRRVSLALPLNEPRGLLSTLGFLPAQHVWYEARKIGNVGYISFNLFLDPARISAQFAAAVEACAACDGMMIDLRGNPGGLGAMSMGMAGWFINKPDLRLGVMKTRENEVKFFVNPRPAVFTGPLAILVDGLTASTSEILAGGLKDLGRARIFGSRTAGAALPSVFEKLPNGDGFQYAIASYISEGGQPLEGIGVVPDEEVRITRAALSAGHDLVLEAALAWISGGEKRNVK